MSVIPNQLKQHFCETPQIKAERIHCGGVQRKSEI